MRYKEIEFSNCGPALNGTIKRKKITAFFGQNNSGKSMVSRLIHGINLMNTAKSRLPQSLRQSAINDENDDTVSQYYNAMVLKNSGMDSRDIITYKRRNARINIKKDAGHLILRSAVNTTHRIICLYRDMPIKHPKFPGIVCTFLLQEQVLFNF